MIRLLASFASVALISMNPVFAGKKERNLNWQSGTVLDS
jgi:hypothetical protein